MSISHLIETYGYLAVFLLEGAESLGIPAARRGLASLKLRSGPAKSATLTIATPPLRICCPP